MAPEDIVSQCDLQLSGLRGVVLLRGSYTFDKQPSFSIIAGESYWVSDVVFVILIYFVFY